LLTDLLKKENTFTWGVSHEQAFNEIKNLVAEAIELTVPNPNKEYVMQTDASGTGIGVVLLQEDDSQVLRPVAIASRKLERAEKNYPTHERELLAIVWGVKHFRYYLEGIRVTVQTDHAALRYIDTQQIPSRRMVRWIEELQQFELVIKYKSGETNVLADLLSRMHDNVLAIDMDTWEDSNWPLLLVPGENNDTPDHLKHLVDKERENFEYDENAEVLYRVEEGKRRAFIPWELRADLVQRFHVGGSHEHWTQVYEKLQSRAWWPYMRRDIKSWCYSCEICQVHSRADLSRKVEAGVIIPATRAFSRWHVDWIGPLPCTVNKNRWIFTAVDELTRWPVAVATNNATEQTVGRLIYEQIVAVFGVPDELVTDRGSNFLAGALQEYLKMLKVKHLRTSAYHPRTNGKVESLNGTLGKALAKAVQGARHKWDEFLPEALLYLRMRKHKATGKTPYELVYGQVSKIPGDTTVPFVLKEEAMDDLVEIRARLLEKLGFERAAALERSQLSAEEAKEQYDKLVNEDPLKVGEWVLLRRGSRLKFQSRWVGPYQVIGTGPNGIYQLKQPDGLVKEDWVHRDRLKRAVTDVHNPPTRFWSEECLENYDEEFGQEGNEII
jgi:hypothetical protein